MKCVTFEMNGSRYGLYYNGLAMFELQELFGDLTAIFDVLHGRSREKLEQLCNIVEVLSTQYAAARAASGFERPKELRSADLRILCGVRDVTRLQELVVKAINIGLSQEFEDEEVDLGLIEFQKKKTEPIGQVSRSTR